MNDLPLWAQIVITIIASGTIGGLAGAYSPILTAQLVYKQKQEENRRTNIGNHIHTLYFPLFNILTKLEEALDLCNKKCEFYQDADEGSIDEFREACLKSIEQISTLLDQGKDTYLTTKLAEHLQSFQKFVQDSIDLELDDGYHESDTALVLIHTPLNTKKLIIHNKRDSDHDKMWNIIQRAKKKKKEIDNIIYAPITSGLFDLRFIHDIQKLKTFIREVVQNTPHTPSISQNS